LAGIYSHLIQKCLVPSVIAEIHMLVSLLLLKNNYQLSSIGKLVAMIDVI